jgi:hypothetical protein
MGCRQRAVLFGKPGKLEKTFELSLVDHRRFYTVATQQSARGRVIELNVLL